MISIKQRLSIGTPADQVCHVINSQAGLLGWWTTDTKAKAEVGSIARFSSGEKYFKEINATELKPGTHVKWTCIKAVDECIGNIISFDF
jgi:hypothetical protein